MRAIAGPYRPEVFGFDPVVCWGVHVGGCVEMDNDEVYKQLDIEAHAHTRMGPNSRWKGWICVIRPSNVFTKTGRPSRLLLHEYGHLICGNREGHGPAWRRVVTELGAASEVKKYERKR